MESTRKKSKYELLGPALLLAVSALLRLLLVAQGGQYFFGDEARYDRGVQLYTSLRAGDFHGARAIMSLPEHALFPVLGALVTACQHILAQFTPYGDWNRPENIIFSMGLGALVLSFFSTLNLYLVFRLSRTVGADDREALWVLFLAVASNTLFYPARHLLPYTCALSAALLGLIIGLRNPSRGRALLCGLFAALCYHLYNGYWYLVPGVGLAYCWWWRNESRPWIAAVLVVVGMSIGIFLPIAFGCWWGGRQYLLYMAAFSTTVTQGRFAEGWRLPWEFFWHAEGLFGLAVVIFGAIGLVATGRAVPDRVRLWLMLLGSAYALLVLFSVVLEWFVVYARTVLPFAPLFCLVGGWAVADRLKTHKRLQVATAVFLAVPAALQFAPHFGRVFPREIEIAIMKHYGVPKHSLSVIGSLYLPLALPVNRPDLVLVNAQLVYPARDYLGYPPGKVLLRFENPLNYLPFQYESHTPAERNFLRTHDISIQLIQLQDPAAIPNDLPSALRFQSANRPTGYQ